MDGLAVPPEILDEIAFQTSQLNDVGPPKDLANLLVTSKSIHRAISSSTVLLARIFRAHFDYAALARRFRPEWLTPHALAEELKTRWKTLKRIRHIAVVWAGRKSDDEKTLLDAWAKTSVIDDLWMAFLMLLESDGKNILQLVKWAKMHDYLNAFQSYKLVPRAERHGFQPEGLDTSLALWVAWLLTDADTLHTESRHQTETYIGLIRPFVFGAHRYDSYFAPWSIFNLPLDPPKDDPDAAQKLSGRYRPMQQEPYMANDQILSNNEQAVQFLQRRFAIGAPIMTLAAINSYFVRMEYLLHVRGILPKRPDPHFITGPDTPPMAPDDYPRQGVHYPPTNNSRIYDTDFNRLVRCLNPYVESSPRGQSLCPPGTFAGAWEGRFAYFEFDAYRDMLAGQHPPAIVQMDELVMGQQPQVWRVSEYHLYASSARKTVPELSPTTSTLKAIDAININSPDGSGSGLEGSSSSAEEIRPLSVGPAINAHVPLRTRFVEVPGGIYVFEEGKVGHLFYRKYVPSEKRVVESAIAEAPSKGSGEDEGEEDEPILDTLITGSGHSAWGPFTLRGRVRQWDGYVSVLKDYSKADEAADTNAGEVV
ncbi:hypothetical protein FRB99_008301 [Tulasnella sp. 403]|nr:hypothetical protein FRB99_008301 [Tulasnella sp. 403]